MESTIYNNAVFRLRENLKVASKNMTVSEACRLVKNTLIPEGFVGDIICLVSTAKAMGDYHPIDQMLLVKANQISK